VLAQVNLEEDHALAGDHHLVEVEAAQIADGVLSRMAAVDHSKDKVDDHLVVFVDHGDLLVEDDLNLEVKEILDGMGDEIDQANINYRKMFQMVKTKLARERGLIL